MSGQVDERFVPLRPAKSWVRRVDRNAERLGKNEAKHKSRCGVFVSNPRSMDSRAGRYLSMASKSDGVGLPKGTVIEFLDNALRITAAYFSGFGGIDYQLLLYGQTIDFGVDNRRLRSESIGSGLPRVFGDLCVILNAAEEAHIFRSTDWSSFGQIPAQRAGLLRSESAETTTIAQDIENIELFVRRDPEAGPYCCQTLIPPLRIYQAVLDNNYDNYRIACRDAAEQYYDFWWVKDNLANLGYGLALHVVAAMSHAHRTRQWPAHDSEVTPAWIAEGEFDRQKGNPA